MRYVLEIEYKQFHKTQYLNSGKKHWLKMVFHFVCTECLVLQNNHLKTLFDGLVIHHTKHFHYLIWFHFFRLLESQQNTINCSKESVSETANFSNFNLYQINSRFFFSFSAHIPYGKRRYLHQSPFFQNLTCSKFIPKMKVFTHIIQLRKN